MWSLLLNLGNRKISSQQKEKKNVTAGTFLFFYWQHWLVFLYKNRSRLNCTQCLQHPWLQKDTKNMEAKKLSKDRMKKYMARRKWQVMERMWNWAGYPKKPHYFQCLWFWGTHHIRGFLLLWKLQCGQGGNAGQQVWFLQLGSRRVHSCTWITEDDPISGYWKAWAHV